MEAVDVFLAVIYIAYVTAPALKDELWLRGLLMVNSVGFVIWGLWVDSPVTVVFNVLFGVISLRHVVRLMRERSAVELTTEQELVHRLFPRLTRRQFLRLWMMGETVVCDGQLIEQGDAVDALMVLTDGEVVVEREGQELARLVPHSMVGELTFIRGGHANASVTCVTSCTLHRWDHAVLRSLEIADPETHRALMAGIAVELVDKLSGTRDQ